MEFNYVEVITMVMCVLRRFGIESRAEAKPN